MTIHIYPTETPVGSYNGDTCDCMREFQEINYQHTMKQSRLTSFLTYGGAVSAGSGLSVNVATGYWVVYGRIVYSDATANVAGLTANTTNYIWLQLGFTGALVTSASFVANTTGSPPTYSVCVGRCVCGASTVTGSPETSKANPGIVEGSYTGDTVDNRLIFLGFQPSKVEVWGDYWDALFGSSNPFMASNGSGGTGYNTKGYASSSDIYCPVITTLGFTVSRSGGVGLNANAMTRYWRAFT